MIRSIQAPEVTLTKAWLIAMSVIAAAPSLKAQSAETVFKGRPEIRISESGVGRVPEKVPAAEAGGYECVISKIGDRYYWASRENRELVRIEYGSFITFVAVDGSGYVRVVNPEFKNAAALISETESRYDYVEHLLIALSSVTYYGKAQR